MNNDDHGCFAASPTVGDVGARVDGEVGVVPDVLLRGSSQVRDLLSAAPTEPFDSAALADEVIGHPGLADALRKFADVWALRLTELGEHLNAVADGMQRAGQRYRATDDGATRRITDVPSTGERSRHGSPQ